ncbi:quercetin 2,3-dioxygenase [Mycobacterium sp.]|uniref:quercetin 2,3-dioxygenase n=1 Tax=Mycobacterium sp. TaxID=1785 RepID=UPI002C0E2C93|nr:quercetin 2,3-dioxygenase [Mycobacterium sp.]HKP39816.1 quercetin 2,3-dioxygenase [Mycobacterium sp.]
MTDHLALPGHVSLDKIGKGSAYILGPGEGQHSLANNTLRTLLARADDTHGDVSVMMSSGDPTRPTMPHFHRNTTEAVFVLDGKIRVWLDDQNGTKIVRDLEAGEFGMLPRNWIHAWKFATPKSRHLGIIAPGGFEHIVEFLDPTQPPSLERLLESERHIDVKWLPDYPLFGEIDDLPVSPVDR